MSKLVPFISLSQNPIKMLVRRPPELPGPLKVLFVLDTYLRSCPWLKKKHTSGVNSLKNPLSCKNSAVVSVVQRAISVDRFDKNLKPLGLLRLDYNLQLTPADLKTCGGNASWKKAIRPRFYYSRSLCITFSPCYGVEIF